MNLNRCEKSAKLSVMHKCADNIPTNQSCRSLDYWLLGHVFGMPGTFLCCWHALYQHQRQQTTATLTDVGIISSHINCNIDSQNIVANNMRWKMQQLVNFQLFPCKWTSIGHVIRFVSVYSHLIQLLDST